MMRRRKQKRLGLRQEAPPVPVDYKRGTWIYEYSRGVYRRWVEAEIAAGTVNDIPGYVWEDWPEGLTRHDGEKP